MSATQDYLYLWQGRLLWATHHTANQIHTHASASLLVSPEEPFAIQFKDATPFETRCILIGANQAFRSETNSPMLVLHIDPELPEHSHLAKALADNAYIAFTEAKLNQLLPAIQSAFANPLSCDEAKALSDQLLSALVAYEAQPVSGLDDRVQFILTHIKDHLHTPLVIEELASKVNLSDSRLMHLFKSQLGLPIRRYVLYLKVRKMARLMKEGKSLAEVSIEAGFADQAHATRTVRSIYGVAPSELSGKTYICVCD